MDDKSDEVVLQKRRCVHIKLLHEHHVALRAALYKRNVSMQAAFDEFARLVVMLDERALSILDDLRLRRMHGRMDKAHPITRITTADGGELSYDVLYDLIEKGGEKDGTA